ncbi:MAG: SPFH domain-containing protein [Phycisphaerae bacterium]|jgi:regulator of protease activity HflC (stomatin/prohibitin superfamily)|nr:SPFH domain-containing protein [Phycisphaerae bacterium]MDP7636707.1 SPFH domain-containing protein [Phycisphaerae bacterium]
MGNEIDNKRSCGGDFDLREEQMDPAQQELAKALRSSFRLLSVIMVVMVALFLLTGLTGIDSTEVGIITRFGRVVAVAEEGLTYAWPFPVGGIEKFDISQQVIEINDFWMHETAEDRTRDLRNRKVDEKGLRPGYDGALLTGDHNLYHVRLKCGFQISRDGWGKGARDPRLLYRLNVNDPVPVEGGKKMPHSREIVRSVVCSAAIAAGAVRTADAIRANKKAFEAAIMRGANERLNRLRSGLKVTYVAMARDTWPLRVLPDFDAAQKAQSGARQIRDEAQSEARGILSDAAGESYRKLVGDLAGELGDEGMKTKGRTEPGNDKLDLIGQYVRAKDEGYLMGQEELLEQINRVLTSPQTKGRAARIIAEAGGESTRFIESVKGRATRFSELLPKYRQNPEFMLSALWAETLEEILASPTVEVILLAEGDRKINLLTKQNPEVARRLARELAKAKKNPNQK